MGEGVPARILASKEACSVFFTTRNSLTLFLCQVTGYTNLRLLRRFPPLRCNNSVASYSLVVQ